jgi:hypothetical protein
MKAFAKGVLVAFALVLMSSTVPLAAAQGNQIQYQHSQGIVTLSTDAIEIKITGAGEVPHFHWWDPNTTDVDYHVMFVKLFEANDTNSNGVFDLGNDTMIGAPFALPTTDWEISEFVTEGEGENVTAVHFNMTSTTTHDPRPDGPGNLPPMAEFDVMMQIRVHLDLEKPGEVKFDVVIDGWDWTYEESILVLQFTVTESNHGQNQGSRDPAGFERTGTKFEFNNGYMEYEDTALAAQNTIQVRASYGEGTGLEAGESVYLAFENFGNETLEYDPTLGIEAEGALPLLDPTTLLLIGGGIVALVVIVAIVKLRK